MSKTRTHCARTPRRHRESTDIRNRLIERDKLPGFLYRIDKKGRTKPKRVNGFPVSLKRLQEESLSLVFFKPSAMAEGLKNRFIALAAEVAGYCGGFTPGPTPTTGGLTPLCPPPCFLSGSGLRTTGLTAVSSTGVVPWTSLAKVAPEGTR